MYYDSRYLLPLICHEKPLTVEQEIVLCSFLCHASTDATISQFNMTSSELLQELLAFVSSQEDDDDDDTTLMDKIRHLCQPGCEVTEEDV